MKPMLTITRHPAFLFAAALMIAGSVTGCRGSITQKNPVHLNWNMDDQAFLPAQEPSAFFEDGRGMRPPVANTIATGELRNDTASDTGQVNGRYLTELPERLELNDALLARGQERYEIYCTPCHSDIGDGHGAVPAYAQTIGTSWVIPDFHDDIRSEYPVGRIYHIASDGFGTMRGYRSQIPQDDRWAIAAWVKALQLTQNATAPADEEGR